MGGSLVQEDHFESLCEQAIEFKLKGVGEASVSRLASIVLVKPDSTFDEELSAAFESRVGCTVKVNPPEEEEFYTGEIQFKDCDPIFFD